MGLEVEIEIEIDGMGTRTGIETDVGRRTRRKYTRRQSAPMEDVREGCIVWDPLDLGFGMIQCGRGSRQRLVDRRPWAMVVVLCCGCVRTVASLEVDADE